MPAFYSTVDSRGRSVLHYDVLYPTKHMDAIISLLLRYDADPTWLDDNNRTPFELALRSSNLVTAGILMVSLKMAETPEWFWQASERDDLLVVTKFLRVTQSKGLDDPFNSEQACAKLEKILEISPSPSVIVMDKPKAIMGPNEVDEKGQTLFTRAVDLRRAALSPALLLSGKRMILPKHADEPRIAQLLLLILWDFVEAWYVRLLATKTGHIQLHAAISECGLISVASSDKMPEVRAHIADGIRSFAAKPGIYYATTTCPDHDTEDTISYKGFFFFSLAVTL